MLLIEITSPSRARSRVEVPDESIIGKGPHSEIRLEGWRIAKEHARLFRTPAGVMLEDLGGFSGISVNGRRVLNQVGPLQAADTIEVCGHQLQLHEPDHVGEQVQAAHPASRSSTAGYRNHRATREIRDSRQAAERLQKDFLEGEQKNGFALVVTPDPGRQELEFKWRKQIHAQLLQTMDLRRHDTHSMSDERLRTETQRLVALQFE